MGYWYDAMFTSEVVSAIVLLLYEFTTRPTSYGFGLFASCFQMDKDALCRIIIGLSKNGK